MLHEITPRDMAHPIPTTEAAERKGCTRQAIINAIQRGEINGRKLGPVWAVADDDTLAAWTVKETGGRVHRARVSAETPEPAES